MTALIVKTIPLPINPENVPSLSLHVLAKNAENVIGRLLDNVLPYVQEIHIVLNDTIDASEKVIRAKVPNEKLNLQHVTSSTDPQLYFPDEPYSYEVGLPLGGEKFEGPYTHAPLLCDWAGIRNLGWSSGCDWRLFLDADDVVAAPQELPGLLALLHNLNADIAATKYVFGLGAGGAANSMSYRERLARNVPNIKWVGSTHEIMTGGLRNVLVEDRLLVTDMKDNWGRGVRVPGRCFKVLYREARMQSWKVTPRHFAYLVQETPGMMSHTWASNVLLNAYLNAAAAPEEVAWVLCMVGEMWEAREDFKTAAYYYERALGWYQSSKAAWRLCRARFMEKDYVGCAEAYEDGVVMRNAPQILDDGPVYAESSKILAGQAHFELGHYDFALELIEDAAKHFSSSQTVLALLERTRTAIQAAKTIG
jgi:tetratricopeptide (TPR) repeat protein